MLSFFRSGLLAGILGAMLGWQAIGHAGNVEVQIRVEEPDLTFAVSPPSIEFTTLIPKNSLRLRRQVSLTNEGNVPFEQIRASVDPSALEPLEWTYVTTTQPEQLESSQFSLNAREVGEPSWIALPTNGGTPTQLNSSPLAPGETLELDQSILLGPNLKPGEGTVLILFEVFDAS